MIFSLSRMELAENSLKDSAQSPAWRRKARPAATSASAPVSRRASPANTSGGRALSCFRARSRAAWSGQGGWWAAGSSRQALGFHLGTPYSVDDGGGIGKAPGREWVRGAAPGPAAASLLGDHGDDP